MTYRLAIFDFDGTLADSFPWFLGVVNSVADRYGFRRIAPGEVDGLRGLGAREIVRAFGVPTWKLPLIAAHMRKLKAAHHGAIGLFPGVDRMLRELAARGLTLAIVSSDAEPNVRATLGAANAARIDVFACGVSLFGKAAKFRAVLKQTGIAAGAAIAIGDEMRDAEAAAAAGIAFGAVAWGYAAADALAGTGPAALFRSIDEIAATLAPP
ncbi:MAG: phosphoglycolate phosphatase [Alphaproteobacteria bacterium]|nr:MAG: phosphoglycolate phosphatase [Alphaproteobacteria bacterium]